MSEVPLDEQLLDSIAEDSNERLRAIADKKATLQKFAALFFIIVFAITLRVSGPSFNGHFGQLERPLDAYQLDQYRTAHKHVDLYYSAHARLLVLMDVVCDNLLIPLHPTTLVALLPPALALVAITLAYLLARHVEAVRYVSMSTGLGTAASLAILPQFVASTLVGRNGAPILATVLALATLYTYRLSISSYSPFVWSHALFALVSGISHALMTLAWPTHLFVSNILAAHATLLLLLRRCNGAIHQAYSLFLIGSVVFVALLRGIKVHHYLNATESFPIVVFIWLQIEQFGPRAFRTLGTKCSFSFKAFSVLVAVVAIIIGLHHSGARTTPSTRFFTLIGDRAANLPYSWSRLFRDFHVALCLMPAGAQFVLGRPTPANILVLLWTAASLFLMTINGSFALLFAPLCSVLASLAVFGFLHSWSSKEAQLVDKYAVLQRQQQRSVQSTTLVSKELGAGLTLLCMLLTMYHLIYCFAFTFDSRLYTPPYQVALKRTDSGNSTMQFVDDRRQVVQWLVENVKESNTVMTWQGACHEMVLLSGRRATLGNDVMAPRSLAKVANLFLGNGNKKWAKKSKKLASYIIVECFHSSDDVAHMGDMFAVLAMAKVKLEHVTLSAQMTTIYQLCSGRLNSSLKEVFLSQNGVVRVYKT